MLVSRAGQEGGVMPVIGWAGLCQRRAGQERSGYMVYISL